MTSSPAHADEPAQAPPGYHYETRARTGQIFWGSVLFGVPYLASVYVAAGGGGTQPGEYGILAVPVVGPAIQVGRFSVLGFIYVPTYDALLVVDTVAQAAGLTLTAIAIASPKKVLVPDAPSAHIVPVPIVLGRSGGGIGVAGTF